MKIVLTADIHYGNQASLEGTGPFMHPAHEQFAKEMHDLRPDILVVAGDCAEGMLGDGNLATFFDTYRNPHGVSLCVPGNHDLWMSNFESSMFSSKLRRFYAAAERHGWIALHDRPYERDGVVVAGHMCWYDFSSADPTIGWSATRWDNSNWSDFDNMMGLRKHCLEWCDQQMVEFDKCLMQLPLDRKYLIMVSHFAGMPEMMADGFRSPNHGAAFMGNYNIWPRVERYGADLYYCGHTHRRQETMKGKTRCINNGSGYGYGSKRYDVVEI